MRLMNAMLFGLMLASSTNVALAHNPSKNMQHDQNAIGWLIVVDEGEIDAAKEAKTKKLSNNVAEFADLMIDQHSDNLKKTQEISEEEKIQPSKDSATMTMEKKLKAKLKSMEKMTDKEFEKAYVKLMVKGHADALKVLDNKYFKNISNEKLKDHFVDTKKHIVEHLEKAKKLDKMH
jgi:putative membrane protein